jgi:S1-C subfamily serine protease
MRRPSALLAWTLSMAPRLLAAIGLVLLLTWSQTAGLAQAQQNERTDPLQSEVTIIAAVPGDARTARTLGTRRSGNGVVIGDDGLVLTIGYLILEASEIHVIDPKGDVVSAEFVAYDHATGFGLIRTSKPLGVTPAKIGTSATLSESDYVVAAASGGGDNATMALVVSRRPFAGAWEYLLANAIFTTPPLRSFQGAALFGRDGSLVGVGSLIIRDITDGKGGPPGNLFVPIDLLKPILADLLTFGHSTEAVRPWVGIYPVEANGVLMVNRLAADGPAEQAGILKGDVMLGVAETPVREMDRFFKLIWALGQSGVDVPLKILRDGKVVDITVKSGDRMKWLRMKPSF